MGGTPVEADKPAEVPVAPSAQPSTCRLALTEAIAIAPSIPDIHGRGGCGGHDLVRLEAVVLPDNHQVAVRPEAILRCEMATAVAMRLLSDDRLEVIAPFGLTDLFQMILRRNAARVSLDEYRRRYTSKRIAERWPRVQIIDDV